ncbi:hypothetical protein D6777_01200 [Candidatus Woesearchaeota archaeon]|nr:MAG: hypothetical protein D6777_01200 [Candidatus Woesearchaeota archaeon]
MYELLNMDTAFTGYMLLRGVEAAWTYLSIYKLREEIIDLILEPLSLEDYLKLHSGGLERRLKK